MTFYAKIWGRANFSEKLCMVKFWQKRIVSHTMLFGKSSRTWIWRKKIWSVTFSFTLGCRGVIEYSRNLIWPRSNFFVFRVWCSFEYSTHINFNNGRLWDIIQICEVFATTWQFYFNTRLYSRFGPLMIKMGCIWSLRSYEKGWKSCSSWSLFGFSKSVCWIPK